jgi:hypothetical protein
MVLVGIIPWLSVLSIAIATPVGAWLVARGTSVCVTDSGVEISQIPFSSSQITIEWDNIQAIERRLFRGSLILKVPQRSGLKDRQRFAFAMLDADWETREVAQAILCRVSPGTTGDGR